MSLGRYIIACQLMKQAKGIKGCCEAANYLRAPFCIASLVALTKPFLFSLTSADFTLLGFAFSIFEISFTLMLPFFSISSYIFSSRVSNAGRDTMFIWEMELPITTAAGEALPERSMQSSRKMFSRSSSTCASLPLITCSSRRWTSTTLLM